MANKGQGFGQSPKKRSRWSLRGKPTSEEQAAADAAVNRWRFGGTARKPSGKKPYYDATKKPKPKDNW